MSASAERRPGVEGALARSEAAFPDWAALSARARGDCLRRLQAGIAARQEDIASIVAVETGKPVTEVVAQEITAALEMIRFLRRRYPGWLKDRIVRYGRPGFLSKANRLRFEPLGLVAVIGPANFPFSLPLMHVCAAAVCGNAAVLKPSDQTPRTASLLKKLFEESGLSPGMVEVVEGGTDAVERIIADPRIRKVLFTGSTDAGRKVARLCGRYFKPCLLELGGVGAAIVTDDADLGQAARGIAWSAFYAAGRSCLGTKRVFVSRRIGPALFDRLKEEVRRLRPGNLLDPAVDLGRVSDPAASARLAGLAADALARGGSVWTPEGEMTPETVKDIRGPAVVSRTNLDMAVLKPEETLPGLILCFREVESDEQAVREANASAFGLGASVWSRDPRRAERIARHLQTGMVWTNDASVGLPPLPWGGTKSSGWGRLFAREALAELTHLKAVSRERRRRPARKFWWFPYTRKKFEILVALNALVYGRGRLAALLRLLPKQRLYPLRFPLRETPHATIETNRTCNIRCRHCYNVDKASVKSIETVKREVDAVLRLRNVQALTILGGEPTLHPDLPEIVAHVKSRGRKCQLLTNGFVWSGRNGAGEDLLDRLVEAGIDKVIVHMDEGQSHVHGDLDRARRTVFRKLEARRVTFSLALTIDRDSAGAIPSLVRRYAKFRYFDGILSLVARDGLRTRPPRPSLEDERARIAGELGLEPISYVPSNLEGGRIRWLIYSYLINAASGRVYGLPPILCGLLGWLYRIVRRRRFFIRRAHPVIGRWLTLPLGLTCAAFRPNGIGEFVGLLRRSAGMGALRLHTVIIQNPAEYNEEAGRYEMCYHCPDATLRNGRLVPVCIADYVDPPKKDDETAVAEELIREVRDHLGESASMS